MAGRCLCGVSRSRWSRSGGALARSVGGTDRQPFLNRRDGGYVGRVFTLDKPIVDGVGTVRIDDTVWRVTGPDMPAGKRVRVEHADGAMLHVVPAQG